MYTCECSTLGGAALAPGPRLVAVGLDLATAGIELRERVAFAVAEIPGTLARLTDPDDPLLEQAAILSTGTASSFIGGASDHGPRGTSSPPSSRVTPSVPSSA